jgi:hypothetical protein
MSHSIYYPKLVYGFTEKFYTQEENNINNELASENGLSIYSESLTISEQSGHISTHRIIYGIELDIDDQTGIPFISESIKHKVFEVYKKTIERKLSINNKFNMSNIKLGYHLAISGDI